MFNFGGGAGPGNSAMFQGALSSAGTAAGGFAGALARGVTPEDMKDEKSWRVKLLKYKIFWRTLPKPKTGPSPFENLTKSIY